MLERALLHITFFYKLPALSNRPSLKIRICKTTVEVFSFKINSVSICFLIKNHLTNYPRTLHIVLNYCLHSHRSRQLWKSTNSNKARPRKWRYFVRSHVTSRATCESATYHFLQEMAAMFLWPKMAFMSVRVSHLSNSQMRR